MRHCYKKYIKAALKDEFLAPVPERKKEFLRNIRHSRTSNISFMLSQILYIRKLVWVLSTSIILCLIFIGRYVSVDLLWPITACMPFVAMIAVSENMRSGIYKMAELEMTARFSLKSITFARMGIVGIFHLILLIVLMIFTGENKTVSFLQTGVYLLVPYLMTTVISLHVARKLRGNEVNYVCMGITVIISVLDALLKTAFPVLCGSECFIYWVVLLVMLVAFTGLEYSKNINETEAALWNL